MSGNGRSSGRRVRLLIVGSGPGGYTAAIYAARADLSPLVIAGSGTNANIGIPGGQLMLTTEVENFPGFPEGVSGPELMDVFRKQAERFGAEILYSDASAVDLSRRPFTVETSEGSFMCDALVIATGARANWLGLESEKRLQNRGVSACATCDGALYRNRDMAVVGGGDSAMEEALFLTRFAKKVTLIHRRDKLRASKIMQARVLGNEKIEILWNSIVVDVLGETEVTGVRVRNVKSGVESDLAVGAVFVAIGHTPNTERFRGQLELTEHGYIRVEPWSTHTSVEGVFACGDVMDRVYRQAITAAGTGCMAAIDAERWLAEQESMAGKADQKEARVVSETSR